MDDWLTIPPDRKTLPTGRLCVIMALTVLLLIVSQVPRKGATPTIVAEAPMR